MRTSVNTSHVTVHQNKNSHGHKHYSCVNTSHVTVHPGCSFYDDRLFGVNTSHVTVHLVCSPNISVFTRCQYIPCYCSSRKAQSAIEELYKCQYIPCYCSSWFRFINSTDILCVNTSHVTVHQNTKEEKTMDKKGVNTSHVTVHLISMRYKFIITNSVNTSHITVHLKNKEKAENEAKRCQYIPCYCSSYHQNLLQKVQSSVNTSHVTVHLMEMKL